MLVPVIMTGKFDQYQQLASRHLRHVSHIIDKMTRRINNAIKLPNVTTTFKLINQLLLAQWLEMRVKAFRRGFVIYHENLKSFGDCFVC